MNSYVILVVIVAILLVLGIIYLVIKNSLTDKNETIKTKEVEKLSPHNSLDVYRLNNLNDNTFGTVRKEKPIVPPDFDKSKPIGYKNNSYGEQRNLTDVFKK